MPPDPDRWGSYDLRRGDHDDRQRWAGEIRSADGGDELPAPGTDGFVRRLQEDLSELGFRIVGTADGIYGRLTEWAVRELQIYAKMDFVAFELPPGPIAPPLYGDRLFQVPNTAVYTGPVSGLLNAQTRAALDEWLGRRWRCPVVVEARRGDDVVHDNLWGKDDLESQVPRMFVRDWSGHHPLPTGVSPGEPMVLGDWEDAGQGGPSSRAPIHTRADAEVTPEELVGVPLPGLSPAQLSTFKVLRAVSEVECMGFFDSVNAWDNAIMSLGPCHWTLGLIGSDGDVGDGELCAYLALLKHFEPADFETSFGFFGARPNETWADADGVENGAPLFGRSLRKYSAWLEQETEAGFEETPAQAADANGFRTWHWFARFVMAGRTVEGFRRRMWDMARIRLRDIRATQWGDGPPAVPDIPADGVGPARPATIGDVFTSEQSLGMITRWHVFRPAHMIRRGNAGPQLCDALARAGIEDVAGHPGEWIDAHEQALIDGLADEARSLGNDGLIRSLGEVRDWHRWGAGGGARNYRLPSAIDDLSAARGSLEFDAAGLPPQP